MLFLLRPVILVLLLHAAFTPSLAQLNRWEWHEIGEEKVGEDLETDKISVDKDRNFRFIRMKVFDPGVIIEKWELEYRNGSTQHIGFFGYARPGFESPPIPLAGKLKRVILRYRSADRNESSKIQIVGME